MKKKKKLQIEDDVVLNTRNAISRITLGSTEVEDTLGK